MLALSLSQPRHNYLYSQAPSEGIKDDWVSALKLMVTYTKLGSISSHAERMKLEDALVSRPAASCGRLALTLTLNP